MSLVTGTSGKPYEQVAKLLKQRIASGEFAVGDRLPTNRELAEEYGVAPNTIANALGLLRRERIIVSQQGRGTFVRAIPQDERPSDEPSPDFELVMRQLDQFQEELRAMGDRLQKLEKLVERLTGEDSPPAR